MEWVILLLVAHFVVSVCFRVYELHQRNKMNRFILDVMAKISKR